jgi:hypothetical protein
MQQGPSGMMPPKYFCDFCQKPGHSTDRCFKNPQNPQSQGMFSPPFGGGNGGGFPGKMQGPPKYFCQICQKGGHTADRCFKNPQNTGMNAGGPQRSNVPRFCANCQQPGHTADRCQKGGEGGGNYGFPMMPGQQDQGQESD